MRKSGWKERTLELFTTPERATSIVGDWAESRFSPLRQWMCIARIAPEFLWRDLSGDALFMAGITLRGLAFGIVLLFGISTVVRLSAFNVAVAYRYPANSLLIGAWFASVVTAGYIAGRWTAARSRHKELAAGLVLVLEFVCIQLALVLWRGVAVNAALVLDILAFCLPVLAGALRARAAMQNRLAA